MHKVMYGMYHSKSLMFHVLVHERTASHTNVRIITSSHSCPKLRNPQLHICRKCYSYMCMSKTLQVHAHVQNRTASCTDSLNPTNSTITHTSARQTQAQTLQRHSYVFRCSDSYSFQYIQYNTAHTCPKHIRFMNMSKAVILALHTCPKPYGFIMCPAFYNFTYVHV